MFVGKAKHSVNKDGRVSIPSKMREVINKEYKSEDLYMTLMPGNILCIYPDEEFKALAEKLSNPPQGTNTSLYDIMDRQRDICSNAEPCKIDGSGRIAIPPEMKDASKINDEALVLGALDHIELWNPENWEWKQNERGAERMKSWSAA